MKKNVLLLPRLLASSLYPILFFLLMLVAARLSAQTELWGMTSNGSLGLGTILKINTDGSGFASFSFEYSTASPTADLLEYDGKFYGMTEKGGKYHYGAIFEYDPAGSGTYTEIHPFDRFKGAYPCGNLIEWGGKFYGMAIRGGSSDGGVLFEYDPTDGEFIVKCHFNNFTRPQGSLIMLGGKFYGMTNYNSGILIEYDPAGAGTYFIKHFFASNTGEVPRGNLIERDGKLYGMTERGGSSNNGVLFEYDPAGAGAYTVKHHFDGANGTRPEGSLLLSGGKLYGMTSEGGSNNSGVLFEYDPTGAGAYTVKHHFDAPNGGLPYGSLTELSGKFYGMTSEGGSSSNGVLFEYDPAGAGAYTVKQNFNGANGDDPRGSLIVFGGKLYGMTSRGGSFNWGVLFEYNPVGAGAYIVKYHFKGANGANPWGSLIMSGGKFYGMTQRGGAAHEGVLFEYDPAGSGYTIKHNFNGANGRVPWGSLIEWGGKFYGMTTWGASYDRGVLFEYDPAGAGTYTVKYQFDYGGVNARLPWGSMIEWGGKLYGMTSEGGNNGRGVLFEYDPVTGVFTMKHHFDGPNGSYPKGDLLVSGGKFYGMTELGGNSNSGVLFEYDPAGAGTYTVKHQFYLAVGRNPKGSLIESGGKLYGMTAAGDSSGNFGVLFEYDLAGAGAYTVKHYFDGAHGGSPQGSLVESGGKFYGMTSRGGSLNHGVIFEYNPAGSGTYTVLRHLQWSDGIYPVGNLIAVTPVSATKAAEVPAFEMRISPNPSSELVYIDIISEKNLRGNLAVYDLQGKQITVLAQNRVFQARERISWQPTNLPAGGYFLRLQTETGVCVEQFVRQ